MIEVIIAIVATLICAVATTIVVAKRSAAAAAVDEKLAAAAANSDPAQKAWALAEWAKARTAQPSVFWWWAVATAGAVVLLVMSFVGGRDAADKALDQQKRDIAALLEEGHRTILLQAEAGRQQSREIAAAANESLRRLGEIRARLEDKILGHKLERALTVLMSDAKSDIAAPPAEPLRRTFPAGK